MEKENGRNELGIGSISMDGVQAMKTRRRDRSAAAARISPRLRIHARFATVTLISATLTPSVLDLQWQTFSNLNIVFYA
ncbi:hypothetical protein SDJN03_16892, partial [Cucurbita argyrosperma subsp. sororia]